jgi:hypothetical protein
MASVYTADADTPEEATVDEGTQALETNNAVDDEVVILSSQKPQLQ